MNWRFINTQFNDGAYNMAVDEAILHYVSLGESPPTLRFYGWNPPSMSLGYFQKLEKSIDILACKNMGIDIVRRLTGGRAVLHHEELTYSVILPENYPNMPSSITESYKILSQGLLKGFEELGVNAILSPETSLNPANFSSGACFDAPSSYELTVEGKKIVGSAQTRQKNTILQHGSILNKLQEDNLFDCLLFPSEKVKEKLKNTFVSKATSIEKIKGIPESWENLCTAFLKGFSNGLNISLSESVLSSNELNLANSLHEKYKSKDWTFKHT